VKNNRHSQFSPSPSPSPVPSRLAGLPGCRAGAYPFERFLMSRASFSIASAFFIKFKLITLLESVLSTSAFSSVAS